MADNTAIEWCDATWNPITGCSVVSPGCTNCYAMRLAGTRMKNHPSRAGLTRGTKAGPVWTGEVRFNEAWLDEPLRWKRPRRIFVCAHGDLFADGVPDAWIDRVFASMALAPQHIFLVLTKRAARMREYLTAEKRHFDDDRVIDPPRSTRMMIAQEMAPLARSGTIGEALDAWNAVDSGDRWPLPNVWLGVSVEDQARADARIPLLLDTPAAKRFISAEPLLGPVDLRMLNFDGITNIDALTGAHGIVQPMRGSGPAIDWVIAGGESGHAARPMHPAWAQSLRDQCTAARVPFFFKQWGHFTPRDRSPGMPGYIEVTGRDPDVAWPDGTIGSGCMDRNGGYGWPLDPVGKKAAGRLLDGREWNEFPT
jgi:protein gp37